MTKRTIYYPEIFELVGNAETKEDKIAVLHKFRNEKGMYDILRLCYDPNIHWIVTRPEIENLAYDYMDIADYDLAPSTLFLEARRRLYNYTTVRQPPLKKYKVLQLIAGMFSVMHHEEVELFKQMVDGCIEKDGLTSELVREAFPGLLSARKEVEEPEPEPEPENVVEVIPESPIEVVQEPEPEKQEKKTPTKKRKGPKSKLDKHKKTILQMLTDGNTKVSIAKKYKTSAGNLANWIKKNKPLDKKD